jgi:hypothetical protein
MKVSLLAISSKIYLVAITFLTVSFLTAVAQTPITVTTDKPAYSDGNTIIISGTVTDQLNMPISIVIKDSSQHLAYIAQTNPNSDNTYSTKAVAGGNLWKTTGTYEIDVTYGGTDRTSKVTFEFVPTSGQPASSTRTQTNATQVVQEFGPLSISIFAISTLAVVILYARVRPSFKI